MTKWLSNLLLGENVIYELRELRGGQISDEQMIKYILMKYLLENKGKFITKTMLKDTEIKFNKGDKK